MASDEQLVAWILLQEIDCLTDDAFVLWHAAPIRPFLFTVRFIEQIFFHDGWRMIISKKGASNRINDLP